jgi:hypothetical protein
MVSGSERAAHHGDSYAAATNLNEAIKPMLPQRAPRSMKNAVLQNQLK